MKRAFAMALALTAIGGSASAQQSPEVTVQSLLSQDYTVVGTFRDSAGAGVFLQKKDKLFFCLVAETPTSPSVATRYCKPVQ